MPLHLATVPLAEKPALRDLLTQYLSELTAYGEVDAAYPYFDAYWRSDERRWPYHIRKDGQIVGFALVNTVSPSGRGTDFSMAEFCILDHARSHGHGNEAAALIFATHSGTWEISIMSSNAPARKFWPHAISTAGARNIECIEQSGEIIYRFIIS